MANYASHRNTCLISCCGSFILAICKEPNENSAMDILYRIRSFHYLVETDRKRCNQSMSKSEPDGIGVKPVKRQTAKLTKEQKEYIEICTCDDCQEFKPDDYYVIKDKIWNRIATENEKICISCLEKRLRRKIRKSDFSNAPVNFIYGFLPLSDASAETKQSVFYWWQMVPKRFWKINHNGW